MNSPVLDLLPRRPALNILNKSHVVVLICEIIELFSALKETELHEYLTSLGVVITKDEIRRKLFLLEKFRLVKKVIYDDATFYVRSNVRYHRLRLALKEGANKDALRINAQCLEYYNAEPKQKKRKKAIAQARQGVRI